MIQAKQIKVVQDSTKNIPNSFISLVESNQNIQKQILPPSKNSLVQAFKKKSKNDQILSLFLSGQNTRRTRQSIKHGGKLNPIQLPQINSDSTRKKKLDRKKSKKSPLTCQDHLQNITKKGKFKKSKSVKKSNQNKEIQKMQKSQSQRMNISQLFQFQASKNKRNLTQSKQIKNQQSINDNQPQINNPQEEQLRVQRNKYTKNKQKKPKIASKNSNNQKIKKRGNKKTVVTIREIEKTSRNRGLQYLVTYEDESIQILPLIELILKHRNVLVEYLQQGL